MKKFDLGQTFTILANVGVIAGIIFLALEIQQANRIALVTAEYELRNSFSAINEAVFTNTELAEFLYQTNELGGAIEGSDISKARSWTHRLLNVWLAATFAYDNGIATEMTYNNILDDVRSSVGSAGPDFRSQWRQSIESFPSLASTDVFVLIDEILDEYEQAEAAQ